MQEQIILVEPAEFDEFPNVDSYSFIFEYWGYKVITTPETRIDIRRGMKIQFANYSFGRSTYHDIRLRWENGIIRFRFKAKGCTYTKLCFLHFAAMRPEILVSLIIQAEAIRNQNRNGVVRYSSDYYATLPYNMPCLTNVTNWEACLRNELEWSRNIKPEQIHILCDEDTIPKQDLSTRPDFEIIISKYEDVTLFYKKKKDLTI